ncbi:MAG: hypothetical protein JNK12_08250 [Acidimicrobiales bacterium]|nr:hypothetical protein [Acidimicrobiales bacterium]
MMTTVAPADSIAALAALRTARRRNRVAKIHWVDALYQVYLTAIFGGGAVLVVSGLVSGDELSQSGIDQVLHEGPAWLGVLVALGVAMGLRSGARGGPIALEAPDVRHVLLSPVPRRAALKSPALRQLRFSMFIAVVVGAIAGQLAVRRLGGAPLAWIACDALFAAATVALTMGCAFLASGHRLRHWQASVLGGVLLIWAIGDALDALPSSPTAFLGEVALWPIDFQAVGAIPVVVAVLLVVAGIAGIGGVSLESAERRTRLVGQLKFAATLQDLRTVIVLRRQLAMELPRATPWIRERHHGRFPIWHRGMRGVLRWPAARIGRVVVVGVAAGLALRGVWEGTIPLAVVAGLALFVGGLDAIEPLAQETDHPGRREALPLPDGYIMVRHLPIAALVMVKIAIVAAITAVVVDPSVDAVKLAAICLLPAALAGGAGAVISVLMGAPEPSDNWQLVPPEVQGARTAFRTVWPPLVATLGTLPVVFARIASENGSNPYEAAVTSGFFVVILAGLVGGWVQQQAAIKAWWRNMQEMQGMGVTPATATAGGGGGDDDGDSGRAGPSSTGGAAPRSTARPGAKPSARKVTTRLERS